MDWVWQVCQLWERSYFCEKSGKIRPQYFIHNKTLLYISIIFRTQTFHLWSQFLKLQLFICFFAEVLFAGALTILKRLDDVDCFSWTNCIRFEHLVSISIYWSIYNSLDIIGLNFIFLFSWACHVLQAYVIACLFSFHRTWSDPESGDSWTKKRISNAEKYAIS